MKRIAALGVLLAGSVWGQCSISITAPSNNATVSGPTTFSSSLSNCSSAVRVEYWFDGARPDGEGTTYTNYSSTGPNFSMVYNLSYLWDGTHAVTARAMDSSGTVLATSAGVNVILNDRNIGSMSLSITGTSGNLTATLTPNITPSSNPDLTSVIANAQYLCYVDGTFVYGGGLTGVSSYTTQMNFTIPSVQYENGTHNVLCGMRTLDGGGTPSAMPSVGAQKSFTVNNGTATRELRLNYSNVFLWLCGTTTAVLSPRFTDTANNDTGTTATFSSGNSAVASVGSCTNVSSCTVTAVSAGLANITATSGSYTTVTRVVVQSGSRLLHTSAKQGSCSHRIAPAIR
jgi:hypothetical protein